MIQIELFWNPIVKIILLRQSNDHRGKQYNSSNLDHSIGSDHGSTYITVKNPRKQLHTAAWTTPCFPIFSPGRIWVACVRRRFEPSKPDHFLWQGTQNALQHVDLSSIASLQAITGLARFTLYQSSSLPVGAVLEDIVLPHAKQVVGLCCLALMYSSVKYVWS